MNINIITIALETVWEILISKTELLQNIKAEARSKIIKKIITEDFEITDEDNAQIIRYITLSLSDLLLLLSPYLVRPFSDYEIEENTLTLSLRGSPDKDNGVAHALGSYIEEYLIQRTLSMWLNADTGALDVKSKIRESLNYRNKSIARPLRPIL